MFWIIMSVSLLIIFIAFVLFRIRGANRDNETTPLSTAEINADGDNQDIKISTLNNKNLMLLLIAYFTKIRWLLETEPESGLIRIREMYQEVLTNYPDLDDYNIFSATFGDLMVFKIEAFMQRNGTVYVINDLPVNAGTKDMVDSCFVLLKEISNRLTGKERELLFEVLKKLRPVVFIEKMDESLSGLKEAYKATSEEVAVLIYRYGY